MKVRVVAIWRRAEWREPEPNACKSLSTVSILEVGETMTNNSEQGKVSSEEVIRLIYERFRPLTKIFGPLYLGGTGRSGDTWQCVSDRDAILALDEPWAR